MSLQSGREKAWAELAGIQPRGYNDTFMFFAAANGWTGTFNDRMIQYLQSITGLPSRNIPDLRRETAILLGLDSWNSVGYEIITLSGPPLIPPTVNAGGPYSGIQGANIAISGTATPGDYPITSTLWTIVSGGAGTFANAAALSTTFQPASSGPYVLRLTATPTVGSPVNDTADLTSTVPVAPTVDAGGPYSGNVSTAIALNGTVVNGTYPTTTQWTIVSGGTGTFGNAAAIDTTFTPDSIGPYVLRLTATPTFGATVNDTANLTSNSAIVAPTVDAGGPYSGTVSTAIALDGTVTPGSDLTPVIQWSILSGGTGTFSSTSNPDATFTPDAEGAYVLQLSADPNDGPAVTDPANLTSNAVATTFYILAQNNDRLLTQDGLNLIVSQGAP